MYLNHLCFFLFYFKGVNNFFSYRKSYIKFNFILTKHYSNFTIIVVDEKINDDF
jgi:hypothetical protein